MPGWKSRQQPPVRAALPKRAKIAAYLPQFALSLTPSPPLLEWRWRRASGLGKPGRVVAMLKCQKCPKPATYHITEVVSEEQYEELHLCEECYQKFFYDSQPQTGGQKAGVGQLEESDEASALNQRECPV